MLLTKILQYGVGSPILVSVRGFRTERNTLHAHTHRIADDIKEAVRDSIHPFIPEMFNQIAQNVVGSAAQQFVDSLTETVSDLLVDVSKDESEDDPILACYNVEELVKLLMKPANEEWTEITGEKDEWRTKILKDTCKDTEGTVMQAALKMQNEARKQTEIEQYVINIGMRSVISALFKKSADTSVNDILRAIVSHVNQQFQLVTVNAQGLCCIDSEQSAHFGVRASYARSAQDCCQRNEMECKVHLGCRWYREAVDETKEKKVIECPRSMVSYIPDTSNPSVPAKSGCAPLTFLKEDGLPQQVYKEPNSETKCNYQMFRYTSDSREESGQNCFVGDSDILEYDPNKDSACLESDSCASVVCMQAALSAFKERCEHADTICEATPKIRSYVLRDYLEVACYRDGEVVDANDREVREQSPEEAKTLIPEVCAGVAKKVKSLADACSAWFQDDETKACCVAIDSARDLTRGKVFKMEQRPGLTTKNVCPTEGCSGCAKVVIGQKALKCESDIRSFEACSPDYRTTDWCVPPRSTKTTTTTSESPSKPRLQSLRGHDDNSGGILSPSSKERDVEII